ncbi:MAG: LiaI-LiaF-like domain-containing protein [Bacteroidia bacterium]
MLGLILVMAGALLLLNNFDLLQLNIREMIKFWPLLLVYSGLVLLAGNKKGWAVSLAMVAITIISIAVYFVFKNPEAYII